MNDEKATESKQFVEAIAVMDILSQANCKMPAFLHINLQVIDGKSRDKYMDLLASAVKTFAAKQNEISNGRVIVAVLTTDEQPSLKRSRRDAPADNVAKVNSSLFVSTIQTLITFFFNLLRTSN